jgi:hypothetical protein
MIILSFNGRQHRLIIAIKRDLDVFNHSSVSLSGMKIARPKRENKVLGGVGPCDGEKNGIA